MVAKVKWVNSWRDIPEDARKRAKVDKGSTLVGLTDRGITYLIRGKASKWMEEHEEYHNAKKHPAKERDYKMYVLHELEANMAAYNKYGQPKHILSHLRGIYNDIRFNVYQRTKQEALSAIGSALVKVKAPVGWKEDYQKLKAITR
jgi:hypothetical protein